MTTHMADIAKFIPPEQLWSSYGYHVAHQGEKDADECFTDANDWFRNHADLWPVLWRHVHSPSVVRALQVPHKTYLVLGYFCKGGLHEVPEPNEVGADHH